ncbi:MAG TPA: hypothetical protein VL993_18745 [Stellaceae bacterium]|nr:hypothetical protein [Stellaceae bacterium]
MVAPLGWRIAGRAGYSSGMAAQGETIFEMIRVGTAVKVTAVDPATGAEAVIVGDPAAGEAELKRLARQKLDYVLAKQRGGR